MSILNIYFFKTNPTLEFITKEKKKIECSRTRHLNFYAIKTSGKLLTPRSSAVSSNKNQPLFENAIDSEFQRTGEKLLQPLNVIQISEKNPNMLVIVCKQLQGGRE